MVLIAEPDGPDTSNLLVLWKEKKGYRQKIQIIKLTSDSKPEQRVRIKAMFDTEQKKVTRKI